MPIQYVKGDLLYTQSIKALAHGCNCAGAMGKGIAIEFRKRWPDMYLAYKELCAIGEFNPGDVFCWEDSEYVIFNLGTQKSWKTKATKQAIIDSLNSMLSLAESKGINEIGLPAIGAGLGGMDWEEVKVILSNSVKNYGIKLIVFEEFVSELDASDAI